MKEAVKVLPMVANGHAITILDLGCGEGKSYDVFTGKNSRIRWIGLDIMDSQEVAARSRSHLPFCSYDGVHIPLADGSVDMVYSRQVFEHVRYPEKLISEIYRTLRPGGVFVGSTSHLEPFHSRSYWNYTPYGFCVLLKDASFRSVVVRPGIDCFGLIYRRLFGYFKLSNLFEPFFRIESPVNALLEAALRVLACPVQRRNAFKLLFCGQFCFRAMK
jgi:SAM-dependent methyltransferase